MFQKRPDFMATLVMRFSSLMISLTLLALIWMSCGGGEEFNLFKPFSEPAHEKETKAKVEEARMSLDDEKYEKALELLVPMVQDPELNSNETSLLYVAAMLGRVQINLWDMIKNFLNSSSTGSSGTKTGLDGFLESVTGSLLGTGSERELKLSAVAEAVAVLRAAPDPSDASITNTACLLAGIMAVPTFTDAKDAMTNTLSALASIRTSAASGGTSCPNINLLDSALESAALASNRFSLVMEVAGGCPFLNLSGASSDLNSIEKQLSSLVTNADKGCDSLPTCPANVPDCQSYFPKCVQDVLKVGQGTAQAQDKILASCELTLHCAVGGSCF